MSLTSPMRILLGPMLVEPKAPSRRTPPSGLSLIHI